MASFLHMAESNGDNLFVLIHDIYIPQIKKSVHSYLIAKSPFLKFVEYGDVFLEIDTESYQFHEH
jgi:hypothetical protein